MTITRAIREGVRFVRLPQWEPSAYLELPLLPDGSVGPWATVHDVSGDVSVFLGALTQDTESRYEALAGRPVHPRVQVNWEREARTALWVNHGCSGSVASLYGDDGELQCHECLHDFLREDYGELSKFGLFNRLKEPEAALRVLGGAQTGAQHEDTSVSDQWMTIIDHHRAMALRFSESRDELKHENRALKQQLAQQADRIAELEQPLAAVPREPLKESAEDFTDAGVSKIVRCLDCGLPYAEFPLDVLLPRAQWLDIHPPDGGVLCAACIVERAAKVPGVTCIHAILEIVPRAVPREPRPGFRCDDCGHTHQGERLAFICIGCPCARREPANGDVQTAPNQLAAVPREPDPQEVLRQARLKIDYAAAVLKHRNDSIERTTRSAVVSITAGLAEAVEAARMLMDELDSALAGRPVPPQEKVVNDEELKARVDSQ